MNRNHRSIWAGICTLQKENQKQELEYQELHQDRINNDEICFIAEGVETGLSIKDAIGEMKNSRVLVTLGKSNFINIDPKSVGQKVILCLDNDGESTFTDKTIHRAVERLMSFGKEVFIAIPNQVPKDTKTIKAEATEIIKTIQIAKLIKTKTDFNDIAKTSGIDAVKKSLDNAVSYQDWKKSIEENKRCQINEIIPSIADKVIRRDKEYYENSKVHSSLFKTQEKEINLSIAAKLIYPELEDSFTKYIKNAKYLDTHSNITHNYVPKDLASKDLSIQKVQKEQREKREEKEQKEQKKQKSIDISRNLDVSNKQKVLSKGELELC